LAAQRTYDYEETSQLVRRKTSATPVCTHLILLQQRQADHTANHARLTGTSCSYSSSTGTAVTSFSRRPNQKPSQPQASVNPD